MNKKGLLKIGTGISALLVPSVLWANALGMVNADVLNVRKAPTTSSEVVTKVKNGDTLEVIENSAGWYKVKLVNGQSAFVKEEYLNLTEIQGTIKATNLNLRTYPHLTTSKVMRTIPMNAKVKILYQVDDFYKIVYNGTIGFASASYIDVPFNTYVLKQSIDQVKEIPLVNSPSNTEVKDEVTNDTTNSSEKPQQPEENDTPQLEQDNSEAIGSQIVDYALQFLGNPYRYGGNDLLTGVDCSGFTQQIMKKFNISIPRTAYAQSTVGKLISQSDIQKGDIVFFGSSPSVITHAGIYIGEGKMIHSSTPATGIIISNAFYSGGKPIQAIRRMH